MYGVCVVNYCMYNVNSHLFV